MYQETVQKIVLWVFRLEDLVLLTCPDFEVGVLTFDGLTITTQSDRICKSAGSLATNKEGGHYVC